MNTYDYQDAFELLGRSTHLDADVAEVLSRLSGDFPDDTPESTMRQVADDCARLSKTAVPDYESGSLTLEQTCAGIRDAVNVLLVLVDNTALNEDDLEETLNTLTTQIAETSNPNDFYRFLCFPLDWIQDHAGGKFLNTGLIEGVPWVVAAALFKGRTSYDEALPGAWVDAQTGVSADYTIAAAASYLSKLDQAARQNIGTLSHTLGKTGLDLLQAAKDALEEDTNPWPVLPKDLNMSYQEETGIAPMHPVTRLIEETNTKLRNALAEAGTAGNEEEGYKASFQLYGVGRTITQIDSYYSRIEDKNYPSIGLPDPPTAEEFEQVLLAWCRATIRIGNAEASSIHYVGQGASAVGHVASGAGRAGAYPAHYPLRPQSLYDDRRLRLFPQLPARIEPGTWWFLRSYIGVEYAKWGETTIPEKRLPAMILAHPDARQGSMTYEDWLVVLSNISQKQLAAFLGDLLAPSTFSPEKITEAVEKHLKRRMRLRAPLRPPGRGTIPG